MGRQHEARSPVGRATDADAVWVVCTTLPSEAEAQRLARLILEARVAACVNCGAPSRSEYWWEDRLETAQEWPLMIKTTAGRYAALETLIMAHHPYDVPEILALPVAAGAAAYLDWVRVTCDPHSAGE
ncbi:divalent-cation tolerance protein CutA [Imbroritus primus]|uniref:divalent-cation tolerance protein CutA n=1 Tax=Imbroritus primus TaxID=3058603 RepID=UPI003D162249